MHAVGFPYLGPSVVKFHEPTSPDSLALNGVKNFLIAACLVTSCKPFSEVAALEQAEPATELVPERKLPNEASVPVVDSGDIADAGQGLRCDVVIDEDFATPSSKWNLALDARIETGKLVLTPPVKGTNGAAWWGERIGRDAILRVTVKLSTAIDSTLGKIGHGIAITWIDAWGEAGAFGLGRPGQEFGFCRTGLSGYAVVADTRDKQLFVLDAATCAEQPKSPTTLFSNDHTLSFDIGANRIAGSLDSKTQFSRDLASTAPALGYFGFTASATDSVTEHSVKSVKVESCH